MHLVNLKKVAYGLKNCSTLAADDNTFYAKNTGALSACASPASANSYSAPSGCVTPAPQASDEPIDLNQLQDMVNELVKALKGE